MDRNRNRDSASRMEPAAPKKRRRTGVDHFGTLCMLLLLACSLVLFARLMATNMLTNFYLIAIMVVLIVVNAAHVIVQLPLRSNKSGKLICGVIALLLSGAMVWTMVAAGAVQSTISRIAGKLVETDVIAVIVREDDRAQTINDTARYTFGYADGIDAENTDALIDHLEESLGTIKTRSSANLTELVDDLYDDACDAIILNEGYIPLLESSEAYADFSQQTRILYEYTISREVEPVGGQNDITGEPFILYCSGIDARTDDLSVKSRSDVNILAVVNPQTHQVLLLNTPRDYYLPLHMNGRMDKLTHAGVFGINESMATLDDLYGIETSYYLRVNFTGLVNIVDALGGVDVESPCRFTTNTMEIPNENGSGFHEERFTFDEGKIHINGREALAFSRERYAFADGDNQRGKNQMAVIKAIVDKASSSAVLSRYEKLLSAVSDSFITNLSYDQISALVKMQQKGGDDWNISTYAVSGEGDTQYTYSAGNAWVMHPDEEMVDTAKKLIQQVLNGQVPDVPVDDEDATGN
jgi:LCP family protein required for cell wall assembly